MASSSNDPVVETDPSGRYKRYKTIIRESATKKVYNGIDGVTGKVIAWSKIELTAKTLRNKNLLERLCAEPQLLKSLRHQNIVSCFHSWIGDKKEYINMITEDFPSGNMGEYIRKHEKTDISAIKNWCTQILKGLDHLHRHDPKIIHRDLNCDNIFVDGSSSIVKIGELGLALIFEQGDTTVQSFSCRPEFMAPELLEGYYYNELIDIYSFGMCVLQMVTRERPYSEYIYKYHIRAKVKSGEKPAALSRVTDPEVKKFIEKCLSPASDRPTAIELLNGPFLQPRPDRLQVQPRPFTLRGKSLGTGPFEMALIIASEQPIKFDFPVNDTTQEVMKKEGLSARMSDAELSLVSELVEKLKTELSSSDVPRKKLLQITSEKREVSPVFRMTTEQVSEVRDMQTD
ncbi:probable serine/threonine-protein kinase WNK6 [Chenopodium quinoa]|uniref:non-specific serine/threonine protein kinase n=1 Tax=Chenopodium quinoa TaxID=63459 RepID=A0A803MJZ0_CHEQI|nr:probable serine/threonine-protein kinase WNK6 [Chenopodium quinoa]